MYIVVEINGHWHAQIDKTGHANKYGEPKLFKSRKEAQAWVERHSYKGMSFRYEIEEVKR